MSLITDPVTLAAGVAAQLPPPRGQSVAWAKITNLSPYLLTLSVAGNTMYLSPWAEDLVSLGVTAAPIGIGPSIPAGGTVPSGASAEAYATWYPANQRPAGNWPITLTANALAASISGGTITLSGQVPVVNGTPSPLQVGGTITAAAQLAGSAPFTAQTKIGVAGTAVQLPNSGTLKVGLVVTPLKANVGPVYLGPSAVTSSNGLELAAGAAPTLLAVSNANLLFINGAGVGDGVTMLAI